MKETALLCILVATLLLACGPARKSVTTEHRVLDPITVSARNNPYELYRGSPSIDWDIFHTRAALSFDMEARTATGRAWLKLHPYAYTSDSISLDAKSMDIDSVGLWDGKHYVPLNYSYIDNKLTIALAKSYTNTDTATIFVRYTAKPYAAPTGGSKAITDDRGLYFVNARNEVPGKPVQIWTQGETEANSHWLPTNDQPNERTTIRLELTVPDSFQTLSNGALIDRSLPANGMRTDIWSMQQPIQVYAIMFAIGKFSIVEDEPWNNVKVNYYVEPSYAPYAKSMFRNTPEMVDYFSTVTGVPYPWNKYSQVVVRDYVSGAMENTTASLFGEFMNQNHREANDKNFEDVVSHELFHQWFGDYVTAESWSNLTVNESFATYGEQLWRRHKYGPASNDELAFEDLSRYLNQTAVNDEPLTRFHYRDKEDMFDRISYQKGAAILNYLHGLVGDEAFYRAMNLYLTGNALKPAETHHWRLAVEEATGQDWNWFFNQWYFRGGHPILDVQYVYDDMTMQLIVNVKQVVTDSGRAYSLPLKAALYYGRERQMMDWKVDKKQQRFSFPYRDGVRPLFVPDQLHWLVGIVKEKKTPRQWYDQFVVSDDYINKRRALTNAVQFPSDSISKQLFHTALRDSLDGIRAYALDLIEQIPERHNWEPDFRKDIFSALKDTSNRVKAAAFEVLGTWRIADAADDAIAALSDSSYMVAGAALEALRKIKKDTSYHFARKVLAGDARADLERAAWSVLAMTADTRDLKFFEENAAYVYGTRKVSFANYLNIYLQNVKDLSAFEQGLKILSELSSTESIRSYRFAVGSILYGAPAFYGELQRRASTSEGKALAAEKQQLATKYRQLVLQHETDPSNIEKYKAMDN